MSDETIDQVAALKAAQQQLASDMQQGLCNLSFGQAQNQSLQGLTYTTWTPEEAAKDHFTFQKAALATRIKQDVKSILISFALLIMFYVLLGALSAHFSHSSLPRTLFFAYYAIASVIAGVSLYLRSKHWVKMLQAKS